MTKNLFQFLLLILLLAACGPNIEDISADYDTAYELARSGQCEEATPLFQNVYENGEEMTREGDDQTLRALAGRGQSACGNLALAVQQQLFEPVRAFEALNNSAYYFSDSSQAAEVRQLYADLWDANSADTLASRNTCRQWTAAAPNFPNPDENAPQFLQACGNMMAGIRSGSLEARDYYRSVLEGYPDAANRAAVEQSLAFETIAYVNSIPDSIFALDQPEPIEGISVAGGSATIAIANRSSDPINIVLAGIDTVVGKVAGCADCGDINDCGEGEPFQLFPVTPGTYQVVIESDSIENQLALMTGFGDINPGVEPYAGTWEIEASTSYPVCFFVETSE